ncbi:MAG: hypothetical protein JRE19_08760 [Deltaproteobacteria bacterium]|nr:hypothetical protein [Deltaproteobacteria bacterium]
MRPLATAPKVVLTRAAFVVAAIDQLDLQDAVRLALLSKKRVDDGAPALAHVIDPVLVDARWSRTTARSAR